MMGGYTMMGGAGGLGMFWMGLFWILVLGLIIWGLLMQFRIQRNIGEIDALEILKRRYARGEISREEFEQASVALR
jgi:putative membrane protein